jgi:hypothetical protein
MNDKVQSILQKEVSRKEFLQHIFFAVLAMMGINGLLKALSQSGSPRRQPSMGYGSSAYGGDKKTLF